MLNFLSKVKSVVKILSLVLVFVVSLEREFVPCELRPEPGKQDN